MTRRTWLMLGLALALVLAVVGGVWAASTFTGGDSQASDCCLDPTCPPGCSVVCPPSCLTSKQAAVSTAVQSCCPSDECCSNEPCCSDSTCPTSKAPSAKEQYTCPPCPFCPGW